MILFPDRGHGDMLVVFRWGEITPPVKGICKAAPISPVFYNDRFAAHLVGVSENRGTLKWMVYNGKPY